MIRRIGPSAGRWLAPPVAMLLAVLLTGSAAAQPVLDMTAPRGPMAEKKPATRPNLTSVPTLPPTRIDLPEAHVGIDNFRFVAPFDLIRTDQIVSISSLDRIKNTSSERGSGTSRTELAPTPPRDFASLGDWTTWGQFAVDLTGVTQALLVRDALVRVQSTPPLQFQAGETACHAAPAAEQLALPPLALALVPLAVTPLVGLALIRIRRAIEPHLQARLARRRKRRPGRTWRPPAATAKRDRRRGRSRRGRRRVRFEANGDPREGDG